MKQGRIHFGVKFLYRGPGREGRKPKIRESSKGRFVIRAGYTTGLSNLHANAQCTHGHARVGKSLFIYPGPRRNG